ncbi:MAG: glycosyltransferase family 2 protein, partial [Bacteroidetes bacterium]|nr:glycosyltransferase family 2 protein [Bacteroidota bacterium]
MPLVSAVIPNYNHERFLGERIESVLNQTYPAVEVILMDDCSTDNSRTVIGRYTSHPAVTKVLYNTVNSGSPFMQWKKGIEESSGTIIWIAESDDVARPDFLARMVDILQKEPAANVAYAASTSSPESFSDPRLSAADEGYEYFNGRDFISRYMLTNTAITNASAVVFRRSAVDDEILSGITEYRYAGDWLFWSHLLAKGGVAKSSVVLNYFRRHPGSVASQSDRRGVFITEGLRVAGYLRRTLGFTIPFHVVRVWASVWAQYQLLL